ncbi:MAG: DUF58 domain-containing protein [Gemmatimonadetes bacterium]|nr:DUF58 domain-containing protein [Gemmatimonadota bacterium]
MDSTNGTSELLPAEILERLGSLDLVARTIVRGFVSGAHRSPFLGSGEDFSRHRAYQQGDDVRRLDWKLYGRTDRLYVRLFQEDSNLQAFLVVDTSESMGFVGDGAVSKLRYSQFLAAALAHVMLRGGDAPGLASFGARTAYHVPPRNRSGHLHDLLLALERLTPGGTGSAAQALDEVGGALRRRGRIILLSDCLEEDGGQALLGAVGRLRARGDEVIVVRVASSLELGETDGGAARYFDPERPHEVTAAVLGSDAGFRQRVAAYYTTLQRGLEERGAEYVGLTTDQPLVSALGVWLMSRARREPVRS